MAGGDSVSDSDWVPPVRKPRAPRRTPPPSASTATRANSGNIRKPRHETLRSRSGPGPRSMRQSNTLAVRRHPAPGGSGSVFTCSSSPVATSRTVTTTRPDSGPVQVSPAPVRVSPAPVRVPSAPAAPTSDLARALAASAADYADVQEAERRLRLRVVDYGYCFPANSMVRRQGDCGPDSIAHHVFRHFQGQGAVSREWQSRREELSLALRGRICDYMVANPDLKPPKSDLTLSQMLPQPDWRAYCDSFRLSGAKIENPFLAAAAMSYGLPIIVVSSVASLDAPIIFRTNAEFPLPQLWIANIEDKHFEPLLRLEGADMDADVCMGDPAHPSGTNRSKRRRAPNSQALHDSSAPAAPDLADAEPIPVSPPAPLQLRKGRKRGVGRPPPPGPSLDPHLSVGVTATETEALTFYQPWFDVINRRSTTPLEHSPDPLLLRAIDHKTRMYKRIPPQARQALIAAVKPALQAMVGGIQTRNGPLFDRALQAFCIVPQFALAQRQDKPAKASDVTSCILRFLDGPTIAVDPAPGAVLPQQTLSPHDLALRKAIRPAAHGAMLKATHRLEALHSGLAGICEPTDRVVEQLRALHPDCADADLPSPHASAPAGLPVSRAGLRRAGTKIANGSAADVFGWTGELLTPLLRDKECVSCLTVIAAHIRDGLAVGVARDWLLASWLIALDKGRDKIRPIAGGTILFKLVATYLMQDAAGAARGLFAASGVQFGVFTSDGVAAAARLAQLTLDADPTHTVLKTDFKNAFNLLSRKLMLQELFSYPQLAPFFRMIHWAYAAETALYARGKDGVAAIVRSRQGVRQGCVFGSLAYAVATLRIFKSLKADAGCEVVAVLDDLTLAGSPSHVFATFDRLCALATDNCLPLQIGKCEALWPLEGHDSFKRLLDHTEMSAATGCLPLLGTAVGNDSAAVAQWVADKIGSWKAPLLDLKSPVVPAQVALLLARTFATAKPNFLARSLPPDLTVEPLTQHDADVLATVSSKLNLQFSDSAEAMLRLPFSAGGVGLTSSAAVAAHGFIASMAATLPYVSRTHLRGTDLSTLATVQALAGALLKVKDHAPNACPTDLDDFLAKFSAGHKDAVGLQSKLGKRYAGCVADRVAAGGLDMRALLAARTDCPYASAPFRAYPLTSEFTLTDEETRFAVAHATNAILPETPSLCSCGSEFSLGHAVLCDAKLVLARHNRLQGRFTAFARLQGIVATANLRLTVQDAAQQQEPDLLLIIGAAPPLEVDVTVTDPLCPSHKATWLRPGAALRAAESRKVNKYELAAGARSHEFAPLAFESHGRVGQDVLKLLRRFAAHTPDDVGLGVSDMMMELQVELLKGNAACARAMFARALARQDCARRLQ